MRNLNKKGKKVCVVGAGPSGLTTIKQLLDEGHLPTCYEKATDLGGVFNFQEKSNGTGGAYENTVLTISNYLMCFSDLPPNGQRRHWHHSEYKKYLQDYASRFNLNQHIIYDHEVKKITMINGGHGGYEVWIKDASGRQFMEKFDALAICKGTHQLAKIPKISGLDRFEGEVIHSSDYKNNSVAKGKNVLCIGLGESSADITREISESAKNCILGLRSYPLLVPRNLENSSSDAWTCRISHSYHSPKSENTISYLILYLYLSLFKKSLLKRKPLEKDSFLQDSKKNMLDLNTPGDPEYIKLIKSWTLLSKGFKFATKNVSFVPNVLNGKIKVNASGIKEIYPDAVEFNDGQKFNIDMVMLGTGYFDDFSFFEGFNLKDNNVRNLFMQSIPTDVPNCAFIGWARPITGGIPACSEMAARYFSLLLSEKVSLPKNVHERIEEDKKFYNAYLKNSPTYNTVVAWKRFMDSYADLIGCQVKTLKYILKPQLFVKLFAGSLVPYQYRLEGPHSLRNEAEEIIKALEITLPSSRILEGIPSNLQMKNSKKRKKLLSQIEIEEPTNVQETDYFRFDVKITEDDVKKYAFRNDDYVQSKVLVHMQ